MLIRPPSRGKLRTSYHGYRLAVTLALGAVAMMMALFSLARHMMRPPRVRPLPNLEAKPRNAEVSLSSPDDDPAASALPDLLAKAADGRDLGKAIHTAEAHRLLEEVTHLGDMDLSSRLKVDVPYESLVDQPADHRAAFLRLRGVMVHLAERESTSGREETPAFFGHVLDIYGRPIAFLVAEDPRPSFRPGSYSDEDNIGVALNGAFLQVVVVATAGGRRPAPLVVIKRLESTPAVRPFREQTPRALTEREFLLQRVQDQVPLAVREQKRAYYFLLNELHDLSGEAVSGRVDPGLTYDSFVESPALVRGAYFRIEGTLIRLDATPMDLQKSGFSRVFEGQIVDRERRPISFVLTEDPSPAFRPKDVTLHNGGPVTLEGAFLMNLAYRNRAGQFTATPLIIARALKPRQTTLGGELTWPAKLAMAALAAFCLAALGFLLWISLRRSRVRKHHERMAEQELSQLDEVEIPARSSEIDLDEYVARHTDGDETA